MELSLRSASAGTSNQENSNAEAQAQATELAEEHFISGLQNAEAVIYIGHARNGGGPDFSPPVLRSADQKPDYKNWYEVKKPGLKLMSKTLAEGERTPALLVLSACATEKHFGEALSGPAVITTTDLIEYDQLLAIGFASLEMLLKERCEEAFLSGVRVAEERVLGQFEHH